MGLEAVVTCDGCGTSMPDQSIMHTSVFTAVVNDTPVTVFFGNACGCKDKLVAKFTGTFPQTVNLPAAPVAQTTPPDVTATV